MKIHSRSIFNIFTLFALLISLLGSAVNVTPVRAVAPVGFTVTKTDDTADGTCSSIDCSLREAIIAANLAAGAETITVPTGTYTLTIAGANESAAATGDLDLASNMTINGVGAGSTIIDGAAIDRVFEVISGGYTVNISDVTIRNGNAAGSTSGGGINNDGTGTLTVTNSTFSGNLATFRGGGINNGGTLTVTNSTFSGNSTATSGGGIFNTVGGTLTVTNSTFSGNSVSGSGSGGGITNLNTLTVTNSTFSGNSAPTGGGIFSNVGTLTVTNSTVSGNSATSSSGGIAYFGGTVTLKNTIVANNTAPTGGNCGGTITAGTDSMTDTTCGSATVKTLAQINLGALTGSPAYFPLNTGSAAIDAGDNTICAAILPVANASQNGATRPIDGDAVVGAVCDIGSYEAPATFTVTFDGNGSTGGATAAQSANSATALTSNGFTRTGYTFAGWNTVAGGGGTSYANSASYPFTASVTLFAQWTVLPSYTVTFDGNGFTGGATAAQTASVDTNLTSNGFTRTGYTFAGWGTAIGGPVAYVNNASYPFTASATLYAQWTAASQTLTFNSNSGTSVTAITQNFDTSVIAPTNPTRIGFTFGGWFTDDGTFVSAYTFPHTMGLSTTIYAKWTVLPSYTVTFDGNGFTGGATAAQTTNVTTALTSNGFTRTNYTFAGWGIVAGGPMVYANNASYSFTASVTLYAQWTINGYTVTFNSNGGTGTMTPQFASVATSLTSNTFARTGYSFAGWNTVALGGGTPYANNASYPFTANVTLYAQWAVDNVPTPTFTDVSFTHWANGYIERLYKFGVTSGCDTNPLKYCPDGKATRAEMAIFILRAKYNTVLTSYTPPAVGTSTGFSDVPVGAFADAWIKQLAKEGITNGCGGGNYCPSANITRAEMAIFLLRGKYGSAYNPPAATGTVFSDVSSTSFAAAWIEQLAKEGVTTGCGAGKFCPSNPVTRAEMAVFLVKAFGLP